MKIIFSAPATTFIVAIVVLGGCSDSDSIDETSDAGECLAIDAYEQPLADLEGPLGCEATTTLTPDPPDGCDGAQALVAEARQSLLDHFAANDCSTDPPDLDAFVAEYEADYASEHEFVEHTIERDEWTIAASEYGANQAGAGPLIVLAHGFPDNQRLYDLVAPALGETRHTVAFDFVGFGRSAGGVDPAELSYEGLVRDIDAVVDYFGVDQIVLVLHDMSGWPGIDWALDNPTRIANLVLLNSSYQPVDGVHPPHVIRALMADDLRPEFLSILGGDKLLRHALFSAQVGRFFEREDLRDIHLPVLAYYDVNVSGRAREVLASVLLLEIVARSAEVPRMRAFDRPVTIAFGRDDPSLNETSARSFHGTFPNSTLELIENAGHYVQYDAHERVTAIVQAAATP